MKNQKEHIATPTFTVGSLQQAIKEGIDNCDAINNFENFRNLTNLVDTLKSSGASDKTTFDKVVTAFVKYHQRALADATALMTWEVAKRSVERTEAFNITDEVFTSVSELAWKRGDAVWLNKVKSELDKVPTINGQEKAADALAQYKTELEMRRNAANRWGRKILFDRLSNEINKSVAFRSSFAASQATVRATDYAGAMRRLTVVLVVATFVAAVSAVAQAIPAWMQWRHPAPAAPPLVVIMRGPSDRRPASPPSSGALLPSNSTPKAPANANTSQTK